jgi:hypothetical protein
VKINISSDPVGKVVNVPGLSNLIDQMKESWTKLKEQLGKVNWSVATAFLTQCLDSIVVYLVEHNVPGQDKKATVLDAISKVYDWVTLSVLPFYLRPFSRLIKMFVINVILSNTIDWIVSKYNSGSWHPQATSEVYKAWMLDNDKIR